MATGPVTCAAELRSNAARFAPPAVSRSVTAGIRSWRGLIGALGCAGALTCGLAVSAPPAVDDRLESRDGRPASARTAQREAPVTLGQCSERVYDRLFFGLRTPDGMVSDAEWAAFLHEVVTPRFPDGLTVVDAHGQWRGDGERDVTVERARVVEIAHADSIAVDRDLDELVSIYKHRFRQRSVMRTRARVEVCL
jgi:hypothetical protein